MPVKTKKVWETEISSLKEELKNLKIDYGTLSEQYQS
jgi:hypothetical protein